MTTTHVIWEDQNSLPIVETLYYPLSDKRNDERTEMFYGLIRVLSARNAAEINLSLSEAECLRTQLDRAIMMAIGKEVAV